MLLEQEREQLMFLPRPRMHGDDRVRVDRIDRLRSLVEELAAVVSGGEAGEEGSHSR